MLTIDIGDNSSNGSPLTPLSIQPGATINVAVVGGSTVNYWGSDDGTGSGTITNGSNQSFTVAPVYLQSQGRSSLQVTGTGY